jgi:hypothetical protein
MLKYKDKIERKAEFLYGNISDTFSGLYGLLN